MPRWCPRRLAGLAGVWLGDGICWLGVPSAVRAGLTVFAWEEGG